MSTATDYYLRNIFNSKPKIIIKNENINILDFRIINSSNIVVSELTSHEKYTLLIQVESQIEYEEFSFSICVNNIHNTRVTSWWSAFVGKKYTLKKGVTTLNIEVYDVKLIPGVYEFILYFESKIYLYLE